MFYDQFIELCEKAGEKPYSVTKSLGIKSTSIVEQWKKGSTPRQPMLEKIAEHFGVTIDYLLTGKEQQSRLFENLLIFGEEKQPAVSGELSEDEAMLLCFYRALPDKDKPTALLVFNLFRLLPEDERQNVLQRLRQAAGRS